MPKMPTTNNPGEVSKLIRGWLEYQKSKNIAEPSDTDLKQFLTAQGYDSGAVDILIAKLPEKEQSDVEKDKEESNIDKAKDGEEDSTEDKKEILGKYKERLSKLSLKQLKALRQELDTSKSKADTTDTKTGTS